MMMMMMMIGKPHECSKYTRQFLRIQPRTPRRMDLANDCVKKRGVCWNQ